MSKHLFIGLGGTGGKILRAMRQRIFEEYGTNDPETRTHAEFLYVDSDENDLNDDKSWTYRGHPVNLSPSQKVNIHGINGAVLRNLNDYPGIKSFISEEDAVLLKNDNVAGIVDTGIGGQRRRFGRLLMANNVNDRLNGFTAILRERIISLMHAQEGDGGITFHIAAGLAGGTGSGSIVDTIAQLHKIIEPMGQDFEIFLYLYVPEIMVPERENAGFYHANGYAALQELNALSLGTYHPTDVSGDINPATGKVRRLVESLNVRPFKMAYLFTDHNEASKVLRKSDKLPMAVADFIFQKTYGQEDGVNTQMQRLINLENNAGAPETTEDGIRVHDTKFMSFGIVRIAYPEPEIKAFTAEKCASSVLKGLIYNKWINNSGFSVEPEEQARQGIAAEVRTPAFLESMHLTSEYLTLEKPIEDFPGSKDFNTYDQYWTNLTNFFSAKILKGDTKRQTWVGQLDNILTNQYNFNFRNLGVNSYFLNMRQQKEVRGFASVISNHIEKTFFDKWITGRHIDHQTISLQKIAIYLSELENFTRERIPKIDERVQILTRQRNEAQSKAEIDKKELTNTGWLSNVLFDTAARRFNNYANQRKLVFQYETTIEACAFAKLALQEIVDRLNDMKQTVGLLLNMFTEGVEEANSLANAAMNINQGNNNNEVEVVIKRFDSEVVENVVKEVIITDEDFQKSLLQNNLAKMREIAEGAGKPTLFKSLYERLEGRFADGRNRDEEKENVEELLLVINPATDISNKLGQNAQEETNQRLLNVNILDKLSTEFATDQQLSDFVNRQLRDRAMTFLQFNDAELNRGNIQMGQGVQVILPAGAQQLNFGRRFKQKILQSFPSSLIDENNSFSENRGGKVNEIVVISVKSGFPLRVVQNLSHLKNQYDNLVSPHNDLSKLNAMLLHTESMTSKEFPSLFDADPKDKKKRNILLAIQLHSIPGLIQKGQDPETGDEVNVVTVGTGFDAADYIIGKDAVETAKLIEENKDLRNALTDYIKDQITERYRSAKEKQEFQANIEKMVTTDVLKACGNNRLSPVFKEYVDVAKEYINQLKQ